MPTRKLWIRTLRFQGRGIPKKNCRGIPKKNCKNSLFIASNQTYKQIAKHSQCDRQTDRQTDWLTDWQADRGRERLIKLNKETIHYGYKTYILHASACFPSDWSPFAVKSSGAA